MEQQLQGMLTHRLGTARTVAALGGTGKRFSANTVPLLPGHGGCRLCEKHRAPALGGGFWSPNPARSLDSSLSSTKVHRQNPGAGVWGAITP